jgi:hypothetical protein
LAVPVVFEAAGVLDDVVAAVVDVLAAAPVEAVAADVELLEPPPHAT